jgi:hypothetical protein
MLQFIISLHSLHHKPEVLNLRSQLIFVFWIELQKIIKTFTWILQSAQKIESEHNLMLLVNLELQQDCFHSFLQDTRTGLAWPNWH